MLTRGTMAIVVEALAKIKFEEHCTRLDNVLKSSLETGFKGERISMQRQNRIVNKFCDCMESSKL